MSSDKSSQHLSEGTSEVNSPVSSSIQPVPLQLFAIQPLDVYPIEVLAKKFPVAINELPLTVNIQFNIAELHLDPESLQAQLILETKVESAEEPKVFEMSFKLLGLFTYNSEYTPEMVSQFLQQGSLSILLPFVRELVLSLSTRLRLPPIVLSLVQLAPPPEALDE